MKKLFVIWLAGVLGLSTAFLLQGAPAVVSQPAPITQVPAPTPYAITTKDGNSQIWQRMVYEKSPSGQIVPKIHSYTELASGLNHLVNGQWVESKEWIDILPNGTAAATNGQHQAYFPGDIYDGAIELVTPDGEQLISRPMGLSYFDGTNSVLIAELTNSIGVVVGNNQVVYPDAFTDFKADLRYTYTKAGFEQDIILRESPPTPESYGLNPATARLQVLTEFFDPPEPAMSSTRLAAQAGLSLTDQTLDFGSMQMIHGRAFLLGQNAQDSGVQVSKQWLLLDGRQFLVEEMPVDAIANGLAALPQTAMGSGMVKLPHLASKHLILPAQRLVKTDPKAMLIAKATLPAQGFVLDYQTVNSGMTGFTFQGDTTYYISGNLYLYGYVTNIFEGGAVLKYTNNVSLTLSSANNLWLANSYRPVVFTAKDDNTVGDIISGSTGSPSGYYASSAIVVGATPNNISNFRIAYANNGISWLSSTVHPNFANGQLVNCNYGISGDAAYLRNVLFSSVNYDLMPIGGTFDAQNCTFNSGSILMNSSGSGGAFVFTNCLIVNVGVVFAPSGYTVSGGNNGFYNIGLGSAFGASATTVYSNPLQVVGGGKSYLANGSSLRNAGTTNIDPVLLASLRSKTTYPPIVYSNVTFSVVTNFSPKATRDTNSRPNLGYHYDPLDYVFASCTANSNMTFNVGTAAAWLSPSYGIFCSSNAYVTFNGTATSPDQWVALDTVQEAAQSSQFTWGISCSWTNPLLQANFTHFSALAGVESPIGFNYGQVNLTNCELYNTFGSVQTQPEYLYFANCLVFRPNWSGLVYGPTTNVFSLQNCTIYGGNLSLYGSIYLSVSNSAFNGTALGLGVVSTNCDYNSFLQGSNRLPNIGPHDVIVTNSYNWQSSWFGNYYQPTNSPLINAGSTTADQLGLYHFTTQTNQTVEGTSQLDIGYHYVATDAYGNPLDTNGDGIPDYLQDANGNGVFDVGDLGEWKISPYGLGGASGLQVFTPLK